MRFDRESKQIVGIFAICGVLIVSGYLFLDIRLARFIADEVGYPFLFSRLISNTPDVLLSLVCSLTSMSWGARLYVSRKPAWRQKAEFLEYVGSALPMAFILKTVLKDVFGRMDTRFWLLHPGSLGFHWFQGGGVFSSFPVGAYGDFHSADDWNRPVFPPVSSGLRRDAPRPCTGFDNDPVPFSKRSGSRRVSWRER